MTSKPNKKITALALYSGGLDSTLACRVVAAQGIRVIAVKFVSPFFGYDLLAREEDHIRAIKAKHGIDLRLVDISEDYFKMLRAPVHGYGKNFNPCVDCKILLLRKAKEMMAELGAEFLITGEVLGQRPMSQRRDTLRVIERDSGCENLLVRPLCARNLKPTPPELAGLIDREKLFAFNGRGRAPQIKLAEELGILDYPSPGGGCILTDPILAKRIEKYFHDNETITVDNILLLLTGRQFKLPGGGRLALGRDQRDNEKLVSLRRPGDYLLEPLDIAGPVAILRHSKEPDQDLDLATALVIRYANKKSYDHTEKQTVVIDLDGAKSQRRILAAEDRIFKAWLI